MTNATNTKGCKPRNNNITVTTTATLLTQIARKHLRIETLATRKRDSLDFPEVPVWGIKSALQAAYEAGLNAARAARPAAPATDADAMVDILRDNLSPEAVTSVAAHIQGASTNDPMVDQQVRWFSEQLVKLLGGNTAYAQLMNELGL